MVMYKGNNGVVQLRVQSGFRALANISYWCVELPDEPDPEWKDAGFRLEDYGRGFAKVNNMPEILSAKYGGTTEAENMFVRLYGERNIECRIWIDECDEVSEIEFSILDKPSISR